MGAFQDRLIRAGSAGALPDDSLSSLPVMTDPDPASGSFLLIKSKSELPYKNITG
jgi:hypothetical protein